MKDLVNIILNLKNYDHKTVITTGTMFSAGILLAVGPYQIDLNTLGHIARLFGFILAIWLIRAIKNGNRDDFCNILFYLFITIILSSIILPIIGGAPIVISLLVGSISTLIASFVVWMLSWMTPPKRKVGF